MKTYIKDFRVNDPVDTVLLVVAKQFRAFRDQSKGKYLCLTLSDRTGQIEARVWQNAETLAAEVVVDDFIQIAGMVEEFGESRQLRVDALAKAAEDGVDLADFLPAAPTSTAELAAHLDEMLKSVHNPDLVRLLDSYFGDAAFRRVYLEAPAAKRIHHAYLGGLAEHSLEVADLVDTVSRFSPGFHRDLALTAALLHDLGKLREYSYRRTIDVTEEGRLIGHTVMGYQMLMERIARLDGFPGDLREQLGHAILAHHGEMEWGAPVVPHTVEAAAVHYADLLSGRVKQYEQVASNSDGPSSRWSFYDSSLGRSLFVAGRGADSD